MKQRPSRSEPVVVGKHLVHMAVDGRVRLPADWRAIFVTTDTPVLMLVPQEGTHVTMVPECRISKEMKALKAWANRPLTAEQSGNVSFADARASVRAATEVRIGADGRFTVPRALREPVGLAGEIVLVGCFDHAEIWSPEKWQVQEEALLAEARRNPSPYLGF